MSSTIQILKMNERTLCDAPCCSCVAEQCGANCRAIRNGTKWSLASRIWKEYVSFLVHSGAALRMAASTSLTCSSRCG